MESMRLNNRNMVNTKIEAESEEEEDTERERDSRMHERGGRRRRERKMSQAAKELLPIGWLPLEG